MNNFFLCFQAMDQGGIVFDAAMQRWHALQFTYGDHWVPSVRNSNIQVGNLETLNITFTSFEA